MKLLEKILVATDFERASKDAFQMAFVLAKEFHSEIILIHVVPEVRGYPMSRGKIRKKVIEKLKQMEIDLRKKGVSSVETIVRFGIPFERIIEHSEELDVNLIVIGSGEKEKQFPLGTTAERIIIYANKPVLVVKRGSSQLIRKILCPIDFSETSERALKNAIHLSKTFQAHLIVLTVFEPLLSSYFGIGQTPGGADRTRHRFVAVCTDRKPTDCYGDHGHDGLPSKNRVSGRAYRGTNQRVFTDPWRPGHKP